MTHTPNSKFRLDDKIAIVTGSGGGIGKGIALEFAHVGAHVVVAEINQSIGEATAREIQGLGKKSLPVVVDVTKSDQVSKLVEISMKEFGRIDILVNVAGGSNRCCPVVQFSEEEWNFRIMLNLTSVFLCCKAISRVMIDQNEGNIINISSHGALRALPGFAVYSAAKAGVISFTRSLAAELARYHVRVNCILPGPIDTEYTAAEKGKGPERAKRSEIPLGRIGTPEDIALAAIYLASDASSFVTGEPIEVNGGPLVRRYDTEIFNEKFPEL